MTELDRRRLLRRTGAAITATGLGTVGSAGSVAAHYSPPMIDTRDHFDSDCNLSDGETTTSYDTDGTVPCLDEGCVDDLTVMVHGWRNDHQDAIAKTDKCAHALYDNYYPGEVIGFSWDADKAYYNFYDAECIAQANGLKLGKALERLKSNGVNELRVVTHSLGVQVLFSAIRWVYDSIYSFGLETVHLHGAAQDNEAPTDKEDWTQENYDAIKNVTRATFNYFSNDDGTLEGYFTDTALGNEGAESGHDVPCNYTDYDATSQVDGHSDYLNNLGYEMMYHMDYVDYYDC